MVIVDEIQHIIELMREGGTFVKNGSTTTPTIPLKKVVFNCNPCTTFDSLADGEHLWQTAVPYYYYGSKQEILRNMDAKAKLMNKEQQYKYPAIILEHNHKEVNLSIDQKKMVKLNLLFANIREPKWTYKQSYDINIKPILLPLVEKFIKTVKQQPNVPAFKTLEHTILPLYGEGALIGSDYIDLIYLPIEILFNSNCKNKTLCTV